MNGRIRIPRKKTRTERPTRAHLSGLLSPHRDILSRQRLQELLGQSEPEARKMKIKIKEEIEVKPEYVYEGMVKKSGNGGVINSLKRFIGRKATILIHEDEAEERCGQKFK